MSDKYIDLEKEIGYTFNNIEYLEIAFTHKSYTNEITCCHHESYERYEFLGDAILEFIVSEYLFEEYKNKTEGELTKLRASLVCEFTLSKISRSLKFGKYGRFSKGEYLTGGSDRDSILCDMFESVVGALYLDGGLVPAKNFIMKYLLTDIENKTLFNDSKTKLQEYAQSKDTQIIYKMLEEIGPDHNKEFHVQVYIGDKPMSKGIGHSRKAAEQMAAYNTLKEIG